MLRNTRLRRIYWFKFHLQNDHMKCLQKTTKYQNQNKETLQARYSTCVFTFHTITNNEHGLWKFIITSLTAEYFTPWYLCQTKDFQSFLGVFEENFYKEPTKRCFLVYFSTKKTKTKIGNSESLCIDDVDRVIHLFKIKIFFLTYTKAYEFTSTWSSLFIAVINPIRYDVNL